MAISAHRCRRGIPATWSAVPQSRDGNRVRDHVLQIVVAEGSWSAEKRDTPLATSSEPHDRYQHRFWPTPRRGGDRRLRFALDASYFTVPDESTLARNLTTNDRIGFSECGGAHVVMGQGRGVAGGLHSELTDLIKELAASRSSPRRPRSTASATRPGRPARHRRPPTNRRPGRVSFPAPRWRVDLHGAEEVR